MGVPSKEATSTARSAVMEQWGWRVGGRVSPVYAENNENDESVVSDHLLCATVSMIANATNTPATTLNTNVATIRSPLSARMLSGTVPCRYVDRHCKYRTVESYNRMKGRVRCAKATMEG